MSSESFTKAGHPVTAALGDIGDAVDATVGAEVWALCDDDLAESLVRLEALAARQAELGPRLIRETEARDLARRLGATNTAAWLRHTLRLRPADARMRVQLANRCDPPTEGPVDWASNPSDGKAGSWSMPATASALAEGAVSAEHAKVVANTMAAMPTCLTSEQLVATEGELAGLGP